MKMKLCLTVYILFGFVSGTLFGAASAKSTKGVGCPSGEELRQMKRPYVFQQFETYDFIWRQGYVLSDDELGKVYNELKLVPMSLEIPYDLKKADMYHRLALIKMFGEQGRISYWLKPCS